MLLSSSLSPNLKSSASPANADSTAASKDAQPSKGVPVDSRATIYPSWSITKITGIDMIL